MVEFTEINKLKGDALMEIVRFKFDSKSMKFVLRICSNKKRDILPPQRA